MCAGITFEQLLRVREEQGIGSFDELKNWTGCCLGCGTCEPYVRLSLSTGRTVFPVLSVREADEAMA